MRDIRAVLFYGIFAIFMWQFVYWTGLLAAGRPLLSASGVNIGLISFKRLSASIACPFLVLGLE